MKHFGKELEGLLVEKTPSGETRFRVRVNGDKNVRITIQSWLPEPHFMEAYYNARNGIKTWIDPTPINILRASPNFSLTIDTMLNRSRQRAKIRGYEFSLEREHIIKTLEDQEGVCAVTGVPFDLSQNPNKGQKRPHCMSIDRIHGLAGYTPDNIRITTVIVNMSLLNWRFEDFFEMCQKVVEKGQMGPTPISGKFDANATSTISNS